MYRVPFGLAPSIIVAILILSAILIAVNPVLTNPADLEFWFFARNHQAAYKAAIKDFQSSNPGVKIDLQLVNRVAVSRRLEAAFWGDVAVPDLVETGIFDNGVFFSGPLDGVGFWDITDKVKETGLHDRIVQSRFASCSSRGRIFGLPHDVHPVMIAYRRDIFEAEGISPDDIKTWDDFVKVGRKLTKDIDGDGVIDRYMIELFDSAWDYYETLLLQRGGGLFGPDGELTMDSELAYATVLDYIPLVAGPNKIADSFNSDSSGQVLTQAMESGYFVCLICPDWRTKLIEKDMSGLKGKMALMPLPAWTKGGRRTSTSGGVMLGITKKTKDKELAWKFATELYYNKKALGGRFKETNIIPPLKDSWDLPEFDAPSEYWSGQPLGRLYINLADDVPLFYTSPYIIYASAKMSEVLATASEYYNKNGDRGFKECVRTLLDEKAADVRKLMERSFSK